MMKVLWKKKKNYRGRIQVIYSTARSPTLESVQKISWRLRAEDGARIPLRRLLNVSVVRTFWVSARPSGCLWHLPGVRDEDKLGATIFFTLVIKAALCSCCCLEVPQHGIEALTSRLISLLSASSRLPENHAGLRASRRGGCRERTQRVFSSGLTGLRCSHMQMMESLGRCVFCRGIQISSLVVFGLRLTEFTVSPAADWSGVCLWCSACVKEGHNSKFICTRSCWRWLGKYKDKSLFLKCNQNCAELFWLAGADPVLAVIIGITNGDVVQLLRKNEKGFEEGIRGFFSPLFSSQIADQRLFLKLPSDVFLLSADFSWHQKWKLERALLPLKALCWS